MSPKKEKPGSAVPRQREARREHRPPEEERLAHEDRITQKAAVYCLLHFPHLWTAGNARRDAAAAGQACWIVPVVLRYPTGFGGEIGLLSYDEAKDEFTVLTDREAMRERARALAEDPEGKRQWDALQAASLRAKEA